MSDRATVTITRTTPPTRSNWALRLGLACSAVALNWASLASAQELGNQANAAAAVGDGVVAGVVTDAETGRALSGALVTVEETGQTVRTDTAGNFRVVGLAPGSYTLTLSFIGRADGVLNVTAPSSGVENVSIALGASDDIVVTGARSAQASALNEQRARDNSATVASSDLTGRFPDNTAAEAMRRLPGVSFQRQEGSGDGQFVSIRGLDSGLNNLRINGVNSAEGNSQNRRVPIDAFQSDSIARIVVNKSLLPNHEGVGIGGAVELETATPFELRRDVRQFSLESNYNEFRERPGYRAGGTFSQVFGDVGVLLSGSIQERYSTSYQFQADTTPRPTTRPVPEPTVFAYDLDTPGASQLRTLRTQRFDIDRENTSLTAALDWQASDSTTLTAIGSFNETRFDRAESRTEFRESNRYVLVSGVSTFVPASLEIRTRGAVQEFESTNNTLVLRGETELDRWSFDYQVGFAEASTFLGTDEIEFRRQNFGNSTFLNVVPGTGGARYMFIDVSNPEAPFVNNFTPAGLALRTDPAQYSFLSADSEFIETTDERISARFDAEYATPISWLTSITAGLKYETTERRDRTFEVLDIDTGSSGRVAADGTILGAAGPVFTLNQADLLRNGLVSFADINQPEYADYTILNFDPGAVRSFIGQAQSTVDAARAINPAGLGGTESVSGVEEDILAGYVMAKLEWGNWDFIGGARVERGELTAIADRTIAIDGGGSLPSINVTLPGQAASSDYTEVLPRFQLNYRPTEDLVFRGAFYTAIARPEYQFLALAQNISGEAGDSFEIELGNPGLDNAYAYNYDLGFEWYTGSVGFVGVNLFYKEIENFIFNSESGFFTGGVAALQDALDAQGIDIDLAAYGATDDNIEVDQPQNGRVAEVYGVELSLLRQFDWLPGWWSGFGLYANVTLQETEATLDFETVSTASPGFAVGDLVTFTSPFFNAPDYIGTLALTYTKYGIDATLSYSAQGEAATAVVPAGDFVQYDQDYDSLDLTFNYTLEGTQGIDATFYFAASDILDDGSKPINHETYGRSSRYLQDIEYDGRSMRFGVRAEF